MYKLNKKSATPANITWIIVFIIFAVIAALIIYSIGVPRLGSSGQTLQDFGISAKDKAEQALQEAGFADDPNYYPDDENEDEDASLADENS